jgi:hypothetical protein
LALSFFVRCHSGFLPRQVSNKNDLGGTSKEKHVALIDPHQLRWLLPPFVCESRCRMRHEPNNHYQTCTDATHYDDL